MRAITSDLEVDALSAITSSATCVLHLGIPADVLLTAQTTVVAHHAQHVSQVKHVMVAMVTGAAHLAMHDLNAHSVPQVRHTVQCRTSICAIPFKVFCQLKNGRP